LAVGGLFRRSMVVGAFVAILEPVGCALPFLALRHIAPSVGVDIVPFSTIEIGVFLVTYIGFLSASLGAIRLDPYRLGYRPWPVALVALGLVALGGVTGNLFYPLVAVCGQALWLLRLGSSNYFDHILHAVLVPVAIVELVSRLV